MDESSTTALSLTERWRLARSEAATAANPADVDWNDAVHDAVVPGTVAATLIGEYKPGMPAGTDYDDYDWWYQCDFSNDVVAAHSELVFDGLATIADVWLNDEPILNSRNMFRSYRVDVSKQLASNNTLTIAFRSVNRDLGQKRARPRWKTNLISNQQLRWIRTTLLGRIPGWTPAIAPVGPWRDVRLEQCNTVCPQGLSVLAALDANLPTVKVRARLAHTDPAAAVSGASLTLLGTTHELDVVASQDGFAIDGQIATADAALWSPQNPALHDYVLSIQVGGKQLTLATGALGFREISIDRKDGRLEFRVNGRDIFCRGACWTSNDIMCLDGDAEKLANCLALFRAAGGNMIRVGGTMVYESDTFYRHCDKLGILVWQDFMFANMDYPSSDSTFLEEASAEVDEQSRRLGCHPCIAVYCGNSEVEQQSAMFGMTPDLWRNDLFYDVMPEILKTNCPGIPYVPSSPSEGALPFHNATGPSHYFGVGAYKQPLESILSAEVRFAAECLAFSNVPSDHSLIGQFGNASPPVHHPEWKAGVPRDSAAGWDFDDVRDHYIKELYRVDPVELRYADKERYIAISQVVSGEVVEFAFNAWRSPKSPCSGALIWQLNDIVPGAGWGFIDSNGQAKPLYYFLKRCWSDVNFCIADLGLDGLALHLVNDTDSAATISVNVKLLQHSKTIIAEENQTISATPAGHAEVSVDELLGRFYDVAYRYRFGPPKHDVVVATMVDAQGRQQQTCCYFPDGRNIRSLGDAKIDFECRDDDGEVKIEMQSDSFLQHVKLYSRTHEFDDNHFHLSPGAPKIIIARRIAGTNRPFRGVLSALNLTHPVAFG